MNRPSPHRWATAALATVLAVAGASCSSSGHAALGPSPYKVVTTTTVAAPTIEAGQGYLELGGHYFPYKVVACVQGAAKNDPSYATRVWGVYGNGYTEGKLFTVELTQYHSDGGPKGLPTVTDTALVHWSNARRRWTPGLPLLRDEVGEDFLGLAVAGGQPVVVHHGRIVLVSLLELVQLRLHLGHLFLHREPGQLLLAA